jgi:hypothetical protein
MRNQRRLRSSGIGRAIGTSVAASAVAIASPAHGDVTISPSVDIRQIVSDNTNDGRGPRGSLELGAAVVATFDTNRLDGSFSYRYAHRFEEFGRVGRNDRHNASANLRAEVIDEFLFVNAGGYASQYATDNRGFSAFSNDDDSGNQTQVFSGYVEPSLYQRIGDFATVAANYRLGGVTVDGAREDGSLPGSIGLDPSDGLGSLLSDSVTHSGGVTVAGTRGANLVNWSLNGQATLEDIDQLNQKYRGYSAGGELGFQVSRKLELLVSGGYEDIENTQDSILFDTITGLPILDADGNLQVDPAQPRRSAFDFSGEYWNVGFRFAPSRRTQLELRGGERYGSLNIFADLNFESRSGITVRGNYSRSLNSFSRLLTQSLNGVVISARRVGGFDQFGVPYCVLGPALGVPGQIFSGDPLAPGSECLLGLTQSVTPATFRADLGTLTVAHNEGSIAWSATAFYDRRRYLDSEQLQSPLQPRIDPTLLGDDESFGLRGRVTFRLDDNENVGVDTLVARNSFALSRDRKDTHLSLGARYFRQLNNRLDASASVYGSHRISENRSDSTSYGASVGLRYRF